MTDQKGSSTLPNSQRAPDELGIENEAICEKLLGWKRSSILGFWFPSPCHVGTLRTPAFTTWADAGLVLEAWTAANNDYDIEGTSTEHGLKISARLRQIKGISYVGDFVGYSETTPLAVRAAAIKYIRSLP